MNIDWWDVVHVIMKNKYLLIYYDYNLNNDIMIVNVNCILGDRWCWWLMDVNVMLFN